MAATIVSIGNGGFNIARDIREAGVLTDAKFIVCDTDADDLARNGQYADMTLKLDSSINPKEFDKNVENIRSITDNFTDELFFVAALGGWTTRLELPLLCTDADQLGKFIWLILSTPSKFEGKEAVKISEDTLQWVISFSNMILLQNNDQLSKIPELTIDDINRPIVDTIANLDFNDIRKNFRRREDYSEFIPSHFRDVTQLVRNPYLFPKI